jgi:hypothetical protein
MVFSTLGHGEPPPQTSALALTPTLTPTVVGERELNLSLFTRIGDRATVPGTERTHDERDAQIFPSPHRRFDGERAG